MKRSTALWRIFGLGLTFAASLAQAQMVPTPTPIDPDFDNGDWTANIFDTDPPRQHTSATPICPEGDVNCARLEEALRTFRVLPVEVGGGARYGKDATDVALRLSLHIAKFDLPQGALGVIPFDMVYLPDAGGFRIRIGLLEGDALFFCNAINGERVAPILSVFETCVDGSERIGYGGSVLHFQRDSQDDGRWAARWLAAQLTYALLANGASPEYLKQRLNAHIGASLDGVFSGAGKGTYLRMNVGISGLIRTDDLRWEANALVAYRPNALAWDDYGLETRVQILHNLILKHREIVNGNPTWLIPASIGVEARYDRWSHPSRSFGQTASLNDVDSWYIGLIFKLAIQ